MTTQEAIEILDNERPHCGERAIYSEGEMCEAFDMAIDALRAKQEAESNDPLTLEQLQEMVGKYVYWDDSCGGGCLVKNGYVVTFDGYTFSLDYVINHGKAYRHKPAQGS